VQAEQIGAHVAMRRDGRRDRQVLDVQSLDGGRAVRAQAIHDGCSSFAADPLADGRPTPGGGSSAVQQEHPYRTRLVIDADAERACVTREVGKLIDGEEGEAQPRPADARVVLDNWGRRIVKWLMVSAADVDTAEAQRVRRAHHILGVHFGVNTEEDQAGCPPVPRAKS
jgi:hypothetical protein